MAAINPKKMTHAVLAAIARGTQAGSPVEVLEQWRTHMLNYTGRFVVRTNEAARVHAAMQLRENMANDHTTMSRTQLQRIYEII
ncbi:MAG: hypothetical protein ACKPKO_59445 [Candidatus Fonsibacter sp.]